MWRDIKGYEGFYQVSNLGRIKGLSRLVQHSVGFLKKLKGRIRKLNLFGMENDPVICWANIFLVLLVVGLIYLFGWAFFRGVDILHDYDQKVYEKNSLK